MRLLSWNLQWCRGMDGRVDVARIVACARSFGDPDVLCLQEVADGFGTLPGAPAGNQARQLAAAFAGFAAAAGWAIDVAGEGGARRRYGNLILSRYPMHRVLRHALPWPADPGSPSMPRLALEATLQAPFGALRVSTTHLEFYSRAQRSAQVERLRALHAEACGQARAGAQPTASSPVFDHEPRPQRAILAGDFNLPAGDALHRRLLEPFDDGAPRFVDAWQQAHPGLAHPPSFRLHGSAHGGAPLCCDFVLLSEDLAPRLREARIDAACTASDHQPVIVTLD